MSLKWSKIQSNIKIRELSFIEVCFCLESQELEKLYLPEPLLEKLEPILFIAQAQTLMRCLSVLELKGLENFSQKPKKILLVLYSQMKLTHCFQKEEDRVEKVVLVELLLISYWQRWMASNKMKIFQLQEQQITRMHLIKQLFVQGVLIKKFMFLIQISMVDKKYLIFILIELQDQMISNLIYQQR